MNDKLKRTECDTCGTRRIREPGTTCPVCASGTMVVPQ